MLEGSPPAARPAGAKNRAWLYGLLAVTAFSITLPATKAAVAHLGPLFAGLGRALPAAFLAALLLLFTRQPLPQRRDLPGLLLVAAGVIVGFPLFTALALQEVPAGYGAMVVGLLPLGTALAAAVLAEEKPSLFFWLLAQLGAALVTGFLFLQTPPQWYAANLLLFLAVASAAIGYAAGGRLARRLGGWQVICWALVLAAPFLFYPVLWASPANLGDIPFSAWAGFFYSAFVSMLLGFFAWYKALALGGIARIGQIQLLQPLFTLFFSRVLLGERFDWKMILVMMMVSGIIALSQRSAHGNI